MSNTKTCPRCRGITSDATFPATGVGFFVTQHQIDGLRGTEDPAAVIMDGLKMFDCPCGAAVWVADRGWFIQVGASEPDSGIR